MESHISRRGFLKTGAMALGAAALCDFGVSGGALAAKQEQAKVYFTRDISVRGLNKIYSMINQGMVGRVGIKLHSGEQYGPNLLPMELIKGLQPNVAGSTIVECNVLYPSPRRTTQGHLETLKINGWDFCPVDIMDAEGDVTLPIPGMREFFDEFSSPMLTERPFTPGVHLTEVAVGKHLLNYDSLLVYTHFKGHAMGGFGGSLKNISIGCASGQGGKRQIHGEGWAKGPLFLERMVEGGKAITSHFGKNITYINVLKNLSVDCDCNAKGVKPTAPDIGIVGSTDILAVDKASVDLVNMLPEMERHDLAERIETRAGLRQLEYMKILGMGNDQYKLVKV
ncbi:MAG: DUF362 domain-containing protein [Desulfovibrio sp.]|nr:DUF362 domain-containing protein [Desulfovibrio sp.]